MTVWTDNAARFATRCEDRTEQLRHEGVNEALRLLRKRENPNRVESATRRLALSVMLQARVAGIDLSAAWWSLPRSTL